MPKPRDYEWYKRFQDDHEDNKRTGLCTTSTTKDNVEKVKEVGTSYGLCETGFINILDIKRVAPKLVQKL